MKATFLNITHSKFICRQDSRFYYTLSRKDDRVYAKVYKEFNEFVSFDLDQTCGYFLIYLFMGTEGNMPIVYRKAHKNCKKIIELELKNGC